MSKVFPDIVTQLPEGGLGIEGLRIYVSHSDTHEVWFLETDVELDYPAHAHKAQWGIVLEGKMELTIFGQTKPYSKGDRYFIPEGAEHSIKMHEGYSEIFF